MTSPWTDDLRGRVKTLWLTNSAKEIVRTLQGEGYTFSRSAIIGLIHRSGMSAENKTEVHPFTSNKRNGASVSARDISVTARPRFNPEAIKLRCVEIEPRHLSLMDLEKGDCRYPYGGDGGEPITFCGHPKQDGSQYCTPHHYLCWVRPISNAPKARVYHGTDFARGAA